MRRSFLCGIDQVSGADYSHRRHFIEQRIYLLSSIFAIDIAAYAVMTNHLHLVVRLSPETIDDWSDREVVERWLCLFKGPLLIQRYHKGLRLNAAEQLKVDEIINCYRLRLGNLGWFMKCLNEPIARMANKEDGCTGHFWEARYRSDALLTEEAVLSCMTYVDLNPIRAGLAATPEQSDHSSIKERISPCLNLAGSIATLIQTHQLNHFNITLKPLLAFEGITTINTQQGIFFNLYDYLELVDITGRIVREDKQGAIVLYLSPILERLGIDRQTWLTNATAFEEIYKKRFARKRRLDKMTA